MALNKLNKDVTIFDSIFKLIPMILKGFLYKAFLSGEGVVLIGKGVRLRCPRNIRISGRLILEDYCEIHALCSEPMTFGKDVSVGAFSVIRPSGYYSRPIGKGLKIGDSSSIGIQCYIGCGGGVAIGNNVMMGPQVSVHSENHVLDKTTQSIKQQGVNRGEVIIGDDCWLGAGSRILAGVRLGQGVVVAAGAVVTKSVPDFKVVAGVPARIIADRNEK